MVGTFACPECGRELEIEGLVPGGLIQCGECATWVEIPFLPRAAATKRWRTARVRSPWERRALRLGLVLMGFALVAAIVGRIVGNRLRSDRERVLAELVASADAAEASGQADRALIEIEAAVSRARATGSARLDTLLTRRAGASLREAKTRLAKLATLDPARAVGEALTLRDRAKTDPALAPLADEIAEALDVQRRREASADLGTAELSLQAGRPEDAFALAARLHDRAGRLGADDAQRFRARAETVIEAAIAQAGVAIPAPSGHFVLGSVDAYANRMDGLWASVLRPRGYLPQPRRSPWRPLWDTRAPYRALVEVTETPGRPFLQSKDLTTDLDVTLKLENQGRLLWQNRVVVTPEDFPANLSINAGGRPASSSGRDPEAERRLHDAALAQFVERASRKLVGLPDRAKASPSP